MVLNGLLINHTEVPAAQKTPCTPAGGAGYQHKVLLEGMGHAEDTGNTAKHYHTLPTVNQVLHT